MEKETLNLADVEAKMEENSSRPPTKTFKNRTIMILGGILLVGTASIVAFALTSQQAYNHASEIMRALEQAELIELNMTASGIYSQDGITPSVYELYLIPEKVNDANVDIKALMKYQQNGNDFELRLNGDEAFGEMYTDGEFQFGRCFAQRDIPPIDEITNAFMNAKVINDENLRCSEGKVLTTRWTFIDINLCIGTSGANEGRIIRAWGNMFEVTVSYRPAESSIVQLVQRKNLEETCESIANRRLTEYDYYHYTEGTYDHHDFVKDT